MPSYMASISVKVDFGGTPYFIGRSVTDAKIVMQENGFAVATIVFHKSQGALLADLLKSSPINLYVKDGSETSWTKLFSGKIRFLKKGLDRQGGTQVTAKCDGSGYGFAEMIVGEEYGYQSRNATVQTAKEIITNSTVGIVPAWVQKILKGSPSGYNYDTTSTDDITGDVPYLYFPFKPASKALGDLLDIIQAIKGTNPGPHWLVNNDNKLLLTTVGTHSAAAIAAGWPTYIGGSSASATFIEGRDFHNFLFDDQAEAINYILYSSKFQWPGGGDLAEEATIPLTDWRNLGLPTIVLTSESDTPQVGSTYLRLTYGNDIYALGSIFYNTTETLNLDLTKCGSMYNVPYFGLWVRRNSTYTPTLLGVGFYTDALNYYQATLNISTLGVGVWQYYQFPIGPYWQVPGQNDGIFQGILRVGSGNWGHIDFVELDALNAPQYATIDYDGIRIFGYVLRAAKNSTLINSSQTKMRIVSDEYAKGDTLNASDDSGTIALLAKAELLREMQTSRVGSFTTKLIRAALPGQLVHVHARPQSGVYEVDADFRIPQLVHNIVQSRCTTDFTVTDDVVNSISRAAFDSINEVTKSYRPEFQDRQSTGTKLRDIDITIPVLEKDYP